jgi:peptidyl-prolyl cis-trans isomerase A (cyclophilin A)
MKPRLLQWLTVFATLGTIAEGAAAAPAPQVEFRTSMGNFTVELYPDKAPITVENFLRYVDDGFYTGTIFHRVIADFMIQGGGMAADMAEKPNKRPPIALESRNGLRNDAGWHWCGHHPFISGFGRR